MRGKYPRMPFDTRDWLCCPELKVLPPDVRGLWMDVLCYMWESPERGVMVNPNGAPYTKAEIVAMVGYDANGGSAWLDKLIDAGVCGVRGDGAIYSRRMLREDDLRRKRASAGSKGGSAARGRIDEPELFPPADVPEPTNRVRERKKEFAEFVHLTQREYDRLVADYGQDAVAWMINKLDNSVGSNSRRRRYTDDNRAIRNWVVDAYHEYKRKNGTNQFSGPGGDPPASGGGATFAKVPD